MRVTLDLLHHKMSELADAKNIEKVRLCKDTTFAWCMMVCAHSHRAPALFVKCTLFFLFFFRQAEVGHVIHGVHIGAL